MAIEYYELRLTIIAAGMHSQNVFIYRIDNTGNVNDFTVASQLRQALDDGAPGTSWIFWFTNMLSEDAYVSYISARRIAPTGGNASPQQFAPDDLPGLEASPIHTQQVAAVLVWISATDPEDTGRNFIPAVPEIALQSSRWTGDADINYDGFIAKHLTNISIAAGLMQAVIYHRPTKTGRIIQNGYLSSKVGTMRKREKPL